MPFPHQTLHDLAEPLRHVHYDTMPQRCPAALNVTQQYHHETAPSVAITGRHGALLYRYLTKPQVSSHNLTSAMHYKTQLNHYFAASCMALPILCRAVPSPNISLGNGTFAWLVSAVTASCTRAIR